MGVWRARDWVKGEDTKKEGKGKGGVEVVGGKGESERLKVCEGPPGGGRGEGAEREAERKGRTPAAPAVAT